MTYQNDLEELSVRLLKSVQYHHGKTKGAEAIAALGEVLGKEWMGKVVYHLMADTFTSVPKEIWVDAKGVAMKINAIKLVRGLDTTMGLKEAKDFIEASAFGHGAQRLTLSKPMGLTEEEFQRRVEGDIRELERIGCTVRK